MDPSAEYQPSDILSFSFSLYSLLEAQETRGFCRFFRFLFTLVPLSSPPLYTRPELNTCTQHFSGSKVAILLHLTVHRPLHAPAKMALSRSLLFPIGFTTLLLAIDAAISLGLVSSMVAFLHSSGRGPFAVASPAGSPLLLAGEPANLVVNQGHTANGAGGTALVLVGFGGSIALWLEHRSRKKVSRPFVLLIPLA